MLEENGLAVSVAHRFGNPTDEIVNEIKEWRQDLVAMGRRGVHGLERLMGSVSEHVLDHERYRSSWSRNDSAGAFSFGFDGQQVKPPPSLGAASGSLWLGDLLRDGGSFLRGPEPQEGEDCE